MDDTQIDALGVLAGAAAEQVAMGNPDWLMVPMEACPELPGEQSDDGVRAIAAIDVLRWLVDQYAETQGA